MRNIAIIGAGISGLTLAHALRHIARITIFEKARGIGGRMSTRYAGDFAFDHGAPFFLVKSQDFCQFLRPLIDAGLVAPWRGRWAHIAHNQSVELSAFPENMFVACPNMNSLCKSLAKDLSIQLACEVAPLKDRQNDQWHLYDKVGANLGSYDAVISTAPSKQTEALFAKHLSQKDLPVTASTSTYVLMLGIKQDWVYEWAAANVDSPIIKNIFVNSLKPGRNPALTCLVVHAQPAWTNLWLDEDLDLVEQQLLKATNNIIDIPASPDYVSTHRWRYAQPHPELGRNACLQTELGLAAVGDWCGSFGVEEAWLAANALASTIRALAR
jgi:renalase